MLFVCHSCYLTVILPTCQNYSSPDKDLMAHQDQMINITLCCPFQLPVRSMFFDMVMFLMANWKRGLPAFVMGIELNLESILMKKHLQKRFPRNPQIKLLCKVSLTTCLSPSHTSCSPPLAKFFFSEICISEASSLVSPSKHQLYYFKFLWHNFLSLNYSYYKMNTEKVPWKKNVCITSMFPGLENYQRRVARMSIRGLGGIWVQENIILWVKKADTYRNSQ